MDWHFLPNDLQKDVMQLMIRTQNGVKLTVGPFDTINREHCKIVNISEQIVGIIIIQCVHRLLSALRNYRFHFCFIRSPKRSILLLCSCEDSVRNLDWKKSDSPWRENKIETKSVPLFCSMKKNYFNNFTIFEWNCNFCIMCDQYIPLFYTLL